MIDRIANGCPPRNNASIIRAAAKRLDVLTQLVIGAELLADPAVVAATPAAVEWTDVTADKVSGFDDRLWPALVMTTTPPTSH
jgi:hypothetical protein